MNIGTAIKQIRKERNLSQVDLAKLSGLTQTSLSQIERGDAFPSQRSLSKICEALQVPPALLYILGLEDADIPADRQSLAQTLYPAFKAIAVQLLGPEQGTLITT